MLGPTGSGAWIPACGNEDYLASIPEEIKDLVSSTQKTLTEWKTKSKRKRFRCQNVQGMILALSSGIHGLKSWSARSAHDLQLNLSSID